jgi:hypothetical protein
VQPNLTNILVIVDYIPFSRTLTLKPSSRVPELRPDGKGEGRHGCDEVWGEPLRDIRDLPQPAAAPRVMLVIAPPVAALALRVGGVG